MKKLIMIIAFGFLAAKFGMALAEGKNDDASIDEFDELFGKKPVPADSEIVGRWFDESPYGGGDITIFRKKGKSYIDASWGQYELNEKKSSLGRRFDKKEGSPSGDHWIIDSDENLQIRDEDGLIRTAKKIKKKR